MNDDSVFLGEKGITSTSANYLANLAQELIAKDRELLDAAKFYSSWVSVVGSDSQPQLALQGKDDLYLKQIPELVDRIAKMNAFCAWMREAIKEKELMLADVDTVSMQSHHQVPTMPVRTTVEVKDILETLDIKERQEYLALEAYAATFGKAIHPGGPFNAARKEAHHVAATPAKTVGEGKDMLIYTLEPSVNIPLMDSVYEQMQHSYRQYEARLNSIKYKLQEKVAETNLQHKNDYDEAMEKYKIAIAELTAEHRTWQATTRQRISKLRIIIPKELQETYEYLNSIGSQGANS